MSIERLAVRADGSAELGLGHVMRTLALAEQAAAAGLEVQYFCRDDPTVSALLSRRTIPIRTVDDERWPSHLTSSDLLVVDAETPDSVLESAGASVVALIDDDAQRDRPVDLIVAPDLDERPSQVSIPMLFGWEHALIRTEFQRDRDDLGSPPRSTNDELIATFGGTDPTHAARRFVESLPPVVPFETITIIEGPGAHPLNVEDRRVSVVRDPDDLVERFKSAAAVVTAAGTTMLELAALGRPMAVAPVVDEQRAAAARMVASGAVPLDLAASPESQLSVSAALRTLGDPIRRADVASSVHQAVDGAGAKRIVDAIVALAGG